MHIRSNTLKGIILKVVALAAFSGCASLSCFRDDALSITIRESIRSETLAFIAGNDAYAVCGNRVVCASLEEMRTLMRFVTFHDPSEFSGEYVRVAYRKGDTVYDLVWVNPFGTLGADNWSKAEFSESEVSLDVNDYTLIQIEAMDAYRERDVGQYFEDGILKSEYCSNLRDDPSFIAALLEKGWFVEKPDPNGSLRIFR